MHSDWLDDPSAEGLDAFYDGRRPISNQSLRFGELLGKDVNAQLQTTGYGTAAHSAVDDATSSMQKGARRRSSCSARLVMSRAPNSRNAVRAGETNAPGALLELLYISNAQDAALLRNNGARQSIAVGIANAILTDLKQTPATPAPSK